MKKYLPFVIGFFALLLLSKTSAGQNAMDTLLPTISASGRRGLKNNNPGNIVKNAANNWLGRVPLSQNTDSRFEQFQTMQYGARALMKILVNYISNYHLDTIPALINRWAPASDGNDPVKYSANVSYWTGIPLTQHLSTSGIGLISMIANAISWQENGIEESKAAGLTPGFFQDAYNLTT